MCTVAGVISLCSKAFRNDGPNKYARRKIENLGVNP